MFEFLHTQVKIVFLSWGVHPLGLGGRGFFTPFNPLDGYETFLGFWNGMHSMVGLYL